MSRRRPQVATTQVRLVKRHNTACAMRNAKRNPPRSRRTNVGHYNLLEPFSPPEDWHEPHGEGGDYRVLVQKPGPGYRHVVTQSEVRDRLAALPQHFLNDLEVVQLSRMTRKKQSFPCYGMQWGMRCTCIRWRSRWWRRSLARRSPPSTTKRKCTEVSGTRTASQLDARLDRGVDPRLLSK